MASVGIKRKVYGWLVRDGNAAGEEQFVGFTDVLSVNSVSISVDPFGSLPQSNTLEGTPPTLPWYWSDPTVVLVRPYRGIGPTLPWYWFDPTVVLVGPFRGIQPPSGSSWFFDWLFSHWKTKSMGTLPRLAVVNSQKTLAFAKNHNQRRGLSLSY